MTPEQTAEVALVREMFASGRARELRCNFHLSQAEFAGAVGKQPSEISRYENGRILPRGETALRIGQFFAQLMENAI